MRLVKHALKYGQGVTIKMKSWIRVALIMLGNTTIKGISKAPVVVNVQLGISRMQTLGRNNRASLMDELSTQDIRVRATTTIDRRIECLANRSHSKGVVIKKDMLAKGRTNIISASEEVKKVMRNRLKIGKNDFALITAHAKLGIDVGGVRKSFSSPMEGMAERAFNIHASKAVNLPSRIKGLVSNRKVNG